MMNGTDIGLTRWQSDEASAQLDFEQAFAAHHRLVYRYALGITRQAALAEDVTQEVFVRLHKNLEAAQRGGMLRAWLLHVTLNVARNCLRGRSRSESRDQLFGMQWLHRSKVDAPDDGLQRQVEIVKTRRALAKLREPLRNGLLLRNEGLSYKEIAAVLGVKEASVGTLLMRARREFIRLFERA